VRIGIGIGVDMMLFGGGGVATPKTILGQTGLMWYDAHEISDGAVTTWPDLSGNGVDFAQATAANQPTRSATGLSATKPGVTFDGSASPNHDILSTANVDWTAATGATWIMVLKDTATSASVVFEKSVSASATLGSCGTFVNEAADLISLAWRGGSSVARNYRSGAQSLASPVVLVNRLDFTQAAAAEMEMYVNGTLQSLTAATGAGEESAGGLGNNPFFLGARSGGVAPWAGTVGELIMVPRAIAAGERASLTALLGAKWGITVA
jgi:hypothetical protein